MSTYLQLLRMTVIPAIFVFEVACVAPQTARTPAPRSKPYDMNVMMASIRGISMGMTVRRVIQESQGRGWTYGRASRQTLEDLLQQKPTMATVYMNLNDPGNSGIFTINDIEIGFQGDWEGYTPLTVNRVCHTYTVPVVKYDEVVAKAKEHLTRLGGFTEKISNGVQFEHRLTYQKVERSSITYAIIHMNPNSPDYVVYYIISSY